MQEMRRIFVFGADGMLGRYVVSYLRLCGHVVCGLTRTDLDIMQLPFSAFTAWAEQAQVSHKDVVINCAGIIPQSNPSPIDMYSYVIANGCFPITMGAICKTIGCHFLHVTTDCAYDGKQGNYLEKDLPNTTCPYGISKAIGEQAAGTILRTSILGEESKRKTSLLEWVRKQDGKQVGGYTNHIWNGVTCLQLAKIIQQIMEHDLWWSGVRHIHSPEALTKFELVSVIARAYGLSVLVQPTETPERVDRSLSSLYPVQNTFHIPSIYIQLDELVAFSTKL